MPDNALKPLAYSYVRMSTAEQLDGDSLRRQAKLSEDYVREHGLELAPENQLRDIGKSAFSGEHIATGAFGVFLKKVRAGEIPAGSYLLVESLDRLSRLNIVTATQLLLDIIQAGIVLVTLSDKKEYRKDSFDQISLLSSFIVLGRANDESAHKSRRGREIWANKRLRLIDPEAAATEAKRLGLKQSDQDKPYTAKCPAWLKLTPDGQFELVEEHANTVKRIFRMALDGQGAFTITRTLNASNAAPLGRSGKWHRSYVTKILTNPATHGEFQPHRMDGKQRKPDGLPIPDYYPPVVSKEDFIGAQAERKQRAVGGRGRKGEKVSNLFSGLAHCAYCGSTMYYVNKGDGPKGGKYLQCAGAQEGTGCDATVWRYGDFEASFFSFVREIDLKNLMTSASQQTRRAQLANDLRRQEQMREALVGEQGRAWAMNEKQPIAYLTSRLVELQAQISTADETILALRASLASDDLHVPEPDPQYIRQALVDVSGDIKVLRERRLRIASELRRLVLKLELGPQGRMHELIWTLNNWDKSSDGETPDVGEQIVSTLGGSPDQTYPFFRVTLRDGTRREVVVYPARPRKSVVKVHVDHTTGRAIWGDQSSSASLSASLSASTSSKRRR